MPEYNGGKTVTDPPEPLLINPEKYVALDVLLRVQTNGTTILSIKPDGQLFIKNVNQHLNKKERRAMIELTRAVIGNVQ